MVPSSLEVVRREVTPKSLGALVRSGMKIVRFVAGVPPMDETGETGGRSASRSPDKMCHTVICSSTPVAPFTFLSRPLCPFSPLLTR